jgi:methionyl-tRNA formyltransferase
MKIVILTGNELRHEFMRKFIASDSQIDVVASYCEGKEKSLKVLVQNDEQEDQLRLKHLEAREVSEEDFFRLYSDSVVDESNPKFINKGDINNPEHVEQIIKLQPDLLIAYGCSLIKTELLDVFEGRFINVHLGLSPYYRGSGTNFWPLVNGEPEFVGATFMYIDSGVDTGEVIHQLRADIHYGDMPVQVGNRLIVDIAKEYCHLIKSFNQIERMPQSVFNSDIEAKYYKKADYTEESVSLLYQRFSDGLVDTYLKTKNERHLASPIIKNSAL